ncbi:glycosyltransferase family 4 protein [Cupriavidus alkaliphilus]|uniref:glycosyltransferase family 4 protein n=1 Tax=Cupriavidus alkaliphilus TaxID=942866 RepID=UPI000DC444EF|nr:glycosyltransferase family 4 protein [Cupriavidus alkaliphilus]RAS10194.1 glycosyltransferase involved in cell wall biosynthesis [Cupriavidus alkaliphilus]
MSNPRILALLPFLVKGALSLQVLREMRRRNFDVTVAFCSDASSVYTPDDMEDFRADKQLLDLSAVPHHDALDVVWREMQRRATGLVLQIGAPLLYHHLPYWKERNPSLRIVDTLYNEIGHTLNHFLYEQCIDGVIVETEHMKRFVERNSAKADARVRIVRNGIDTEWLTPAAEAPSGNGLVVGYVGRMSPEKNPLGFIDLIERIYPQLPDARFVLAGDGAQTDEVRRRVQKSPAGGQLQYRGYASDVRAVLQTLDVLVLPSKLDGRPNIVMEANACGIPVIGAPVGGVPELITEGVNGFLAHPAESDRILGILSAWRQNPAELTRFKQSSRQYAERHFSRQQMMDSYDDVFRELGEKAPH